MINGTTESTPTLPPESAGECSRTMAEGQQVPDPARAAILDRDELAALRAIVEGTARSTGAAFFQSLVQHLASAIGVNYAFVAEFARVADARPHHRVLGPGADQRQRRIRTGRDPLRGRGARGALPSSPRGPGEVSATIKTSSTWRSRATWACRCSTATARCSATSRSATSGRCPPSPAGCSSSGSSPPGPPSSSNGCGSRSSSSRASAATGSSTTKHPTPMWRSASIDGSRASTTAPRNCWAYRRPSWWTSPCSPCSPRRWPGGREPRRRSAPASTAGRSPAGSWRCSAGTASRSGSACG